MSTVSSRNLKTLRSLGMRLYERVQLTELILAEPFGPLDTESRDPGDPWQLYYGTGATLPETLHLSIELGIKALIEVFGRPGVIKEHDLCKLLALLGHGSDEGREAAFYLSRSFDSAVQVYGLLRGWGEVSRFESIQKYFRSTGRSEHYEAYRYNQPSMYSDLEESINSVWNRIDIRLHLEIVRTLMYSASYFERSLEPDGTPNPPPQMLESRFPYWRGFAAAALPKGGDVTPPEAHIGQEHLDWIRNAVRASYRGETTSDSPQERAALAMDEESKNNIAVRYKLDLWRRTEPDPVLPPGLADGYVLSHDSGFNAYIHSKIGTMLGSVSQRSDGLWNAKPHGRREKSVLSSREHAIRFVVRRSTQLAHVFVNDQHLGEMYLVRYLGSDFGHVKGYPCGWDGSRYRFEFLESGQFAIGDDIGFGFTDKGKDEGEPEGIGGSVADTDEHVVFVSYLWGMGWDGSNLRRLYGIRFPSVGREHGERTDDA